MVVRGVSSQAEVKLVSAGRLIFVHGTDFLDNLGTRDENHMGTSACSAEFPEAGQRFYSL